MSPHVDISDDLQPKRKTPSVTSLGVFGSPGGFCISPGMGPLGPVEHAEGMRKARFGWCVLQAFSGAVSDDDWPVWIRELERRDIAWGWWARCYTADDVKRLAVLTRGYRRKLVVFNCETELVTGSVTVADLRSVADDLARDGTECGLSTESPLYRSVEWRALGRYVVLPQAFANEHPTKTAEGAYVQARTEGVRVNVTVGVYPVDGRERMTVSDYRPLPSAWSVYPLDNLDSWEGV